MGSGEVQERTEAARGLMEELRLQWLGGRVVSPRRAGALQVAGATGKVWRCEQDPDHSLEAFRTGSGGEGGLKPRAGGGLACNSLERGWVPSQRWAGSCR